jgi:hypothetical protein
MSTIRRPRRRSELLALFLIRSVECRSGLREQFLFRGAESRVYTKVKSYRRRHFRSSSIERARFAAWKFPSTTTRVGKHLSQRGNHVFTYHGLVLLKYSHGPYRKVPTHAHGTCAFDETTSNASGLVAFDVFRPQPVARGISPFPCASTSIL